MLVLPCGDFGRNELASLIGINGSVLIFGIVETALVGINGSVLIFGIVESALFSGDK